MKTLKYFWLSQSLSLSDVISVTVSQPINQGDGNRPSDWGTRVEMFGFLKPLRALSVHTVNKKEKMELSPNNRTCCSNIHMYIYTYTFFCMFFFFYIFAVIKQLSCFLYNKLRRKSFYFLNKTCISSHVGLWEQQSMFQLQQTRHNWIFQLFSSSYLPVLSAYLPGILRGKCIIASAFLQCA